MEGGIESIFGEVIHSYSREQAIEDGVLVDFEAIAPGMYAQLGIRMGVALTSAVFDSVVSLHPAAQRAMNDLNGRAWDLAWMSNCAIRSMVRRNMTVGFFKMLAVMPGRSVAKTITLKIVLGPDDEGRPCATIMLPNED